MQPCLASESQKSACLCLLCAVIKGMHHHAQLKLEYFFFSHVWYFACIYICLRVCVPRASWCSQKPEEGIKPLETEITGSCELPCRCQQLNSESLIGQQMFLIVPTLEYFFKFQLRKKEKLYRATHDGTNKIISTLAFKLVKDCELYDRLNQYQEFCIQIINLNTNTVNAR